MGNSNFKTYKSIKGNTLSTPQDLDDRYVLANYQVELLTENEEHFGKSVAINATGDTIVVGAPQYDQGMLNVGRAVVYKKSNNMWSEHSVLMSDIPDEVNRLFGSSVAINATGDVIVVGAPATISYDGKIFVFVYNGLTWDVYRILEVPNQTASMFGFSVAINATGDTIVIGSPRYDSYLGKVTVLHKNGATWNTFTRKVITPTLDYLSGGEFGYSVDIDAIGDTIVVGAPGGTVNGFTDAGQARVFESNNVDWNAATTITETILSTSTPTNVLESAGISVNINDAGNIIAVGVPLKDGTGSSIGQIELFVYATTWNNIQPKIITEQTPADENRFGGSVALNSLGNYLVGGAIGVGTGGTGKAVLVYNNNDWDTGAPYTKTEFFPAIAELAESFGYSVDINAVGDTIVVGNPYYNGDGVDKGRVIIFTYN